MSVWDDVFFLFYFRNFWDLSNVMSIFVKLHLELSGKNLKMIYWLSNYVSMTFKDTSGYISKTFTKYKKIASSRHPNISYQLIKFVLLKTGSKSLSNILLTPKRHSNDFNSFFLFMFYTQKCNFVLVCKFGVFFFISCIFEVITTCICMILCFKLKN